MWYNPLIFLKERDGAKGLDSVYRDHKRLYRCASRLSFANALFGCAGFDQKRTHQRMGRLAGFGVGQRSALRKASKYERSFFIF